MRPVFRLGLIALLATSACAAVHETRSDPRDPTPGSSRSAKQAAIPGAQPDAAPDVAPESEANTTAVPIEGSDLVHGRSTVTVAAPIDRVREVVLDFAHYPEFMPHYTKCKALGRTQTGGRDVYMEVEALHGAVKMWARVEITKAMTDNGVELHDSRFVEGNVKDFKAVWRLRRIDEGHTELSLEVFLHPNLPMPKNLLNEQNLEKSALGVLAMRTRIEHAAAPAAAK